LFEQGSADVPAVRYDQGNKRQSDKKMMKVFPTEKNSFDCSFSYTHKNQKKALAPCFNLRVGDKAGACRNALRSNG
jgi:hypothetical protein